MNGQLKYNNLEKHSLEISKSNTTVKRNSIAFDVSLSSTTTSENSSITPRRPKFDTTNHGYKISRCIPTNEHLIYSQSNSLAMKTIRKDLLSPSHSDLSQLYNATICTYTKHKLPITLIQTTVEGWLVCTCSEDSVILWKWDSLIKDNWDYSHIGADLGKITSAAISYKENLIYISLARQGDIIIIRCKGESNFTSVGLLLLTDMKIYATIDKLTEINAWLGNVILNNTNNEYEASASCLHVLGFSSKSGVSLKVWSIVDDQQSQSVKLKVRYALQMKKLTAADLIHNNEKDIYYLFALGSDSYAEIIIGSLSNISLLNRVKIGESQLLQRILQNSDQSQIGIMGHSSNNNSVVAQVEFRVLSCKFVSIDNSITVESSLAYHTELSPTNIETGINLFPELDNSLKLNPKQFEPLCPKLHVIIASTKGIFIINVCNGEIEYQLNYHDIPELNEIVVSNAQLATNSITNDIICVISPFLQSFLITFNILVEDPLKISLKLDLEKSKRLSLISLEPISTKSVLRKKLKSPTRIEMQEMKNRSRSKWGSSVNLSTTIHSISNNNAAGIRSNKATATGKPKLRPVAGPSTLSTKSRIQHKSKIRPSIPEFQLPNNNSSNNCTSLLNSTYCATTTTSIDKTSSTSSGNGAGLLSARSSKPSSLSSSAAAATAAEKNRLQYNSKIDLKFDEKTTIKNTFETRMVESLSYMRLAFNTDGNYLIACGNVCPLLIYKVKPKLELVGTYRDMNRVSSVGFSFDSKYLILATNDGNTTVLNWKLGQKILFELNFNSKFNEHIHSQFYYMDKFILQPEDNKIVLYSYRSEDAQKLKAGSFIMSCQNITALIAPNQLYSNLIFYGGSNKSLSTFDANAEKVIWTVPNAHNKNINCIRLNEAPKGSNAMILCDYFLTSSNSWLDPIKLWDLRSARCVSRIADNNYNTFAPLTRPSLSPCGRYIASGFEANSLVVYDVRKINSRLVTYKGLKSSILDTIFDPQEPIIWSGLKNGTLWNFIPSQ